MYDILTVYDQFTTLGLQDNVIYDIIPIVPLAFESTLVNATVFAADCGRVPNALETGFERDTFSSNRWNFDVGYGNEAAFITPGKWAKSLSLVISNCSSGCVSMPGVLYYSVIRRKITKCYKRNRICLNPESSCGRLRWGCHA